MNIEQRLQEWTAFKAEVSEEERAKLCTIRKWVLGMCHKQELETSDVYVSVCPKNCEQGINTKATVIAILKNLPDSPLITIAKAPADVTIEDLIHCYKLMNYCVCEEE